MLSPRAGAWATGAPIRFVEGFYRELAAAGRSSRRCGQPSWLPSRKGRRPVWAAFSVVGDPMVRVPLQEPRSLVRWWAGGSLAVIAIVVAAARRRSAPADPQLAKR